MSAKNTIKNHPQYIVKFFMTSRNRADRDWLIEDLIAETECDQKCHYARRPRKVREGAVIYMGFFVKDPKDILICGRGIGIAYVDVRDDVRPEDKRDEELKKRFPHFIRVKNVRLSEGSLKDGVSLYKIMDKFKHESFVSTLKRFNNGEKNINPKRAYGQQGAAELTPKAARWLDRELNKIFKTIGCIYSN